MGIGSAEYQLRTMLLNDLNLQVVMDHARSDPGFLAQLITQLQERGENRTAAENLLLEWACSTRRSQSAEE
jgi:hypothetical protein